MVLHGYQILLTFKCSSHNSDAAKQVITQYADSIVPTCNPAVLPDGSNQADAPPHKTLPHACNQVYSEIEDFDQDLADLVATCQRHTRCSAAYCLRTKNRKQECRFEYPKPLQPNTAIVTEDTEPVLLTKCNDGVEYLVKSYNLIKNVW